MSVQKFYNFLRIDVHKTVINLSVTDQLNLTQDVTRGPRLFVPDFLFLYHTIKIEGDKYQVLQDTLNLSQTIDVINHRPVTNTLLLSQSIDVKKSINLTVANTLTLANVLRYYKPRIDFYHDPDNPEYSFGHSKFYIQYEQRIISLRNPDFGNNEKVEASRIMRRTRGGNLIVFRQSTWPSSKEHSYTFSGIDPYVISDLLDFLQQTIGKTIYWRDHLGKGWQGFIMTPAAEASEQYRNNYTVTLEFQGERYP
jgi:hypothetical protein